MNISESNIFTWPIRSFKREPILFFLHLAAFLAILAGILVRFKGLGKWPFTEDEFYMAQSVRRILAHGLPEIPCGGYYMRGIAYQYLAAPFLGWGEHDEFYMRLFPALANCLAIWPLYRLSRKAAGQIAACVVIIAFSFSIWEIEFARFARMYAIFQTLFLFYLYYLYRVVVDEDQSAWKWMFGLSIAGLFIYEGAIFPALLNFLPFLLLKTRITSRQFLMAVFVLAVSAGYLSVDFDSWGVVQHYPPDMPPRSGSGGSAIHLPFTLASSVGNNLEWIPLLLPGAIFSVYVLVKIIRSHQIDFRAKLVLISLILLSGTNLYGLLAAVFLIAVMLDIIAWKEFKLREGKLLLYAVCINAITWIIYGVFTNEWYGFFQNIHSFSVKKLMVLFFKYPAVYEQAVYPWIDWVPHLSVFISASIAAGFIVALVKNRDNFPFRFFLSILAALVLVVGAVRVPVYTTRYTFFLYPLVLLLVFISLNNLVSLFLPHPRAAGILAAAIFFIGFSSTEDWNIRHMRYIDTYATNYRIDSDEKLSYHWFVRYDWRSPAEFVNTNLGKTDLVITMPALPSSYYLKRTDYVFVMGNLRYFSICGGKHERWTNAGILYREDQLLRVIDKSKRTIWLIARTPRSYSYDNIPIKNISAKFGAQAKYESNDGRFRVYEIRPS